MALGARPQSIVGIVLRDSFAVAAVGVVVGLPLALIAGRLIGAQLYGVTPASATALAVAAGSLMAVTLLACLVPVRRATAVDPLTALRSD